MSKPTKNSPSTAGGDTGAATAGRLEGDDTASLNGPEAAGLGTAGPAASDLAPVADAAETVIEATRPQDAARLREAAAGSAVEAPSLGAGALADLAGSAVAGSTDAATLAPRPALASFTGLRPFVDKLAHPYPSSATVLADLRAGGFDFIVVSRQAGFRRAGVAHPVDPTLRRSKDFAADELEQLFGDPMLVVTVLR